MADTVINLRREPDALGERVFDVLVVGAGIHGACIARDAAMRGLSVALIDKADFGSATSHNSLKLIHGGIRYLQHLDIRRVRESIRERDFWLRCAPHLTRALRFVIPAYGYGPRGVAALGLATQLYRLAGIGCATDGPPSHAVPAGGVLRRRDVLRMLPDLDTRRFSGGIHWTDGQMLDADRILLECVQSAVDAGAVACNYVEARAFLRSRDGISGVVAEDLLGGRELSIRARHCINAAGPWIDAVLGRDISRQRSDCPTGLSRCINLVTRRVIEQPSGACAYGVVSNRSSDSLVDRGRRMFFVTPWRDLSVIGTSHLPYRGHPDDLSCDGADIETFLDEINAAYPFGLTAADVHYYHVGLTPAEDGLRRGQVRRARAGVIVDHRETDGLSGLTSVIGVKYTTARLVAERTVDRVMRALGRGRAPCETASTPLPGAMCGTPDDAHPAPAHPTVDNAYSLRLRSTAAVRNEMAVRLGDFVFRRSNLAESGQADAAAVHVCAASMGDALNWSPEQRRLEIDEVLSRLPFAARTDTSRTGTVTVLRPHDDGRDADMMIEGGAR